MNTDPWPWTYFHPHELASPDTGEALMQEDFMYQLDLLRERVGHPIGVTSGYRTKKHNAAIGGSPRSAHMLGRAADIVVRPSRRAKLIRWATDTGFHGIGIAKHFIHLDNIRPNEDDRQRPYLWIYG